MSFRIHKYQNMYYLISPFHFEDKDIIAQHFIYDLHVCQTFGNSVSTNQELVYDQHILSL